jgi:hypothetical protein
MRLIKFYLNRRCSYTLTDAFSSNCNSKKEEKNWMKNICQKKYVSNGREKNRGNIDDVSNWICRRHFLKMWTLFHFLMCIANDKNIQLEMWACSVAVRGRDVEHISSSWLLMLLHNSLCQAAFSAHFISTPPSSLLDTQQLKPQEHLGWQSDFNLSATFLFYREYIVPFCVYL